MSYNSQQKLQDNIQAIRIALEWREGQILSDEQVVGLKKYAGFGGLKAVLFPNAPKEEWVKLKTSKEDLKLYPSIIELHQLLQKHFNEAEYKQAIDSIKNSILTAFFTPEIIPQTVLNALKEYGIEPKNMYEPSSAAGVFITEATKVFPALENITAVEKDILSGRVLTALGSSIPVPVSVQIKGFEETSNEENSKSDLIISNIPFGNFRIYDDAFKDEAITGKIHNYFFAKGLDKLKEGGLLAFITTDAFLNSPSNKEARDHVFHNSNYISLNVMPDNLMKDTGNTEASSHLIILQKNSNKKDLTAYEQELIETVERKNEFGTYFLNKYIDNYPNIILGDEIKPGKNQYGRAHQAIWQNGNINNISTKLAESIKGGIDQRFNRKSFNLSTVNENITPGKQLTFLAMPESKPDNNFIQLGMFDIAPAGNFNRASAYDFVVNNNTRPKQYFYMARLGLGNINNNYIIASFFSGQKKIFASTTIAEALLLC